MESKYVTLGKEIAAGVRELALGVEQEAPRGRVVDIGHYLWRLADLTDSTLEKVKERMREEARKEGQTTTFVGDSGTRCRVLIDPPRPHVVKPEQLKDVLGPVFEDLFETVVSYRLREGFDEKLLTLSPEQRQAILQRLQMPDPTPRVSFKV